MKNLEMSIYGNGCSYIPEKSKEDTDIQRIAEILNAEVVRRATHSATLLLPPREIGGVKYSATLLDVYPRKDNVIRLTRNVPEDQRKKLEKEGYEVRIGYH